MRVFEERAVTVSEAANTDASVKIEPLAISVFVEAAGLILTTEIWVCSEFVAAATLYDGRLGPLVV